MHNADYWSEIPDSMSFQQGATREDIANLLMNQPLFDNFNPREIALLSRYFKLYTAPQNSMQFDAGDAGDFIAIIVQGISLLGEPGKMLVLSRQNFDLMISECNRTGVQLAWKLCRSLSRQQAEEAAGTDVSRYFL